jgi:SAM-dependent methyltransferase
MRIAALRCSAAPPPPGVEEHFAGRPATWGRALREAVAATSAEVLLVDPPPEPSALVSALEAGALDVVQGRRAAQPLPERPVSWLARLAMGSDLADAACPARAFSVSALRALPPWSDGQAAEAEVLGALAAAQYRFGEVEVTGVRPRALGEVPALLQAWRRALAAEGPVPLHGGDATLRVLEAGAPNYNRWLADTFATYAGQRVLEVGAGQGTITARLARGRELVTALELEAGYVERLRRRFRGQANVEALQADVLEADPAPFRARGYDTIVLSNVLEHLSDDARAVRTFARILPPGGRLILFVPALAPLFGTLDTAVGHHRRYGRETLRQVVEENGFELEVLRSMNLLGIPGWYLNGRVLERTTLPPLQVRLYDAVAPALARLEARVELPVGLSLLAVAERRASAPPRAESSPPRAG